MLAHSRQLQIPSDLASIAHTLLFFLKAFMTLAQLHFNTWHMLIALLQFLWGFFFCFCFCHGNPNSSRQFANQCNYARHKSANLLLEPRKVVRLWEEAREVVARNYCWPVFRDSCRGVLIEAEKCTIAMCQSFPRIRCLCEVYNGKRPRVTEGGKTQHAIF